MVNGYHIYIVDEADSSQERTLGEQAKRRDK